MIGIIDYGMGNIHSVQKAIENLGAKTLVSSNAKDIAGCEKLILPGVGAFDDAVLELKKQGLDSVIKENLKKNKPLLGICLGMQLFFENSQEGGLAGLGILKGGVKKFPDDGQLKVPHMGWNQLIIKQPSCPLLKGLDKESSVYFCHSYFVDPLEKSNTAAATEYGREFTSIVWKDNIYGVQFHPEKSQEIGLKILRNFIAL